MHIGPWKNYFAWLPTQVDGRTVWLELIQRRRVVVPINLAFADPILQVVWQYRNRP